MRKKLVSLVIVSMLVPNISFAKNISTKDIEEEGFRQEKLKQEVLTELVKGFNSLDDFNEVGTLYWENGKLKIGVKSGKVLPASIEEYTLEAIKNKNNPNVEILEVKYTTKELVNLIPEVRKDYLTIGNEENLITILTREDLGKVEVIVNKSNKEVEELLKEKYKDKVKLTIKENLERPKLEDFNDIEINDWYYEPIKELYDKELIKGYIDGSFKPNAFITREEAAQIASKIASISVMEKAENGVSVNKFIDVNDDKWSSEAINYLKENKIMLGRDENKFYPDIEITREETAVLANRILDFRRVPRMEEAEKPFGIFSDSKEISSWAEAEVNLLYKNSIIRGYPDGTFKPRGNITRSEFTSIMYKLMKSIESANQ